MIKLRNGIKLSRYTLGVFTVFLTFNSLSFSEYLLLHNGLVSMVTVRGTLSESPCSVDMNSVEQTIDLGDLSTSEFNRIGDEGKPVQFQIKLHDCPSVNHAMLDINHGNTLIWAPGQQTAYLTFYSEQQENGLVFLTGNSRGIALRIEDNLHRNIPVGIKSYPQIIYSGENVITFYVIPHQIENMVIAGEFNATINLSLSYE